MQQKYAYTHTHTHLYIVCVCVRPLLDPWAILTFSTLQAQQLRLHLVRVPTRLAGSFGWPQDTMSRRGLKVYATPLGKLTLLNTRTNTHTHAHVCTHPPQARQSERERERGTISQFVYCRELPRFVRFGFFFGFGLGLATAAAAAGNVKVNYFSHAFT